MMFVKQVFGIALTVLVSAENLLQLFYRLVYIYVGFY